MNEAALENIRTRRVARAMLKKPVERDKLERILDAGRWAPSGSNYRLHRFVVVQDATTIHLLRIMSPGMFQRAPAAILICIDWDEAARHQLPRQNRPIHIDIGTAAQNMMLAAHALGLGSGPVTSFSAEGVRAILNLPQRLTPEMFVCVGYAAKQKQSQMRAWKKTTWRDLTFWGRFEDGE